MYTLSLLSKENKKNKGGGQLPHDPTPLTRYQFHSVAELGFSQGWGTPGALIYLGGGGGAGASFPLPIWFTFSMIFVGAPGICGGGGSRAPPPPMPPSPWLRS